MKAIGLDKWPRFLADAAARADANRPIVLAQLANPTIATDAAWAGEPALQKGQGHARFEKQFDAATAAAYRRYSKDCSHYLRTFLMEMGFADTPFRTANAFMKFVEQKNSGWTAVTAQQAVQLSANGHVVVAGLAVPEGHGHVAVVGPRMIPATLVAGHPTSPQVFSGASSSWQGSRSQGEHSVADSWARGDRTKVVYWVRQ